MNRNDDGFIDYQLLNTLVLYDAMSTMSDYYIHHPSTPKPAIATLPNDEIYEFKGIKVEGSYLNMLNWATRGWFLINPIKLCSLLVLFIMYWLLRCDSRRRVD